MGAATRNAMTVEQARVALKDLIVASVEMGSPKANIIYESTRDPVTNEWKQEKTDPGVPTYTEIGQKIVDQSNHSNFPWTSIRDIKPMMIVGEEKYSITSDQAMNAEQRKIKRTRVNITDIVRTS